MLILILNLLLAIAIAAQTVAFINVNVIPMDKEQSLKNQTVLIKNGVITEIGRKVKIPTDATKIDGKDKYTRGHSERVSRVSVAIGKRLGLDEVELETLRISSLLHDVGKIAIDDSILKKPAALTAEEYEIMKSHPQQGYKIMSQIPAMKDFLPGMYMHHEMVNGAGYPQGLKGDEIPLQAKIISIADAFDAMTIDRPYSKGMSLEDALNLIKSFVGTRYDGKVVEALVQACTDGQVGVGIVRLKAKMPNNVNLRKPRSADIVTASQPNIK